jgi:hypothetical protein
MPEKQFKAEIVFGGKVEPSVTESFNKFHEQLKEIQEQAVEATETLKEMGEAVTDFGIALLGIEEAKDVFEFLNESGQTYLKTQREINIALEEQMRQLGRGPEGLRKAKEELEELNEEWRKNSTFSRDAIESMEAALLGAKGPQGQRINLEGIKRLVPAVLAATERTGKFEMSEAEAGAAGKEIAEFILRGGRGPIEALGIEEGSKRVRDWMKEHYGAIGKGAKREAPAEYTPAMAAEHLRSLLGGSAKDLADLKKSIGVGAAQPAEAARSIQEIATRLGTTMTEAFQPVARMMNLILGGDPSGKGSPLDRFLDNIDEKSREFDNWVKTDFTKTWQDLGATFTNAWNAIEPLFDPAAKDIWAALSGFFDIASRAIQAIAGYTKENFPSIK